MADRGDELIFHAVQGLTLAHVPKVENAARHRTVHLHGSQREFHRKRRTVGPIEDVLPVGSVLRKQPTTYVAVGSACSWAAVDVFVHDGMDESASQRSRGRAKHLGGRRIGEGNTAMLVSSQNAIGDGIENGFLLTVQLGDPLFLNGTAEELPYGSADGFHRRH